MLITPGHDDFKLDLRPSRKFSLKFNLRASVAKLRRSLPFDFLNFSHLLLSVAIDAKHRFASVSNDGIMMLHIKIQSSLKESSKFLIRF